MNETQNAVSKAANPQAALLQIAVSLDRLHAKLDAPPAETGWGEWQEAPWAEGYGPPQDGTHDEARTTLNVTTDESGEPAIEEIDVQPRPTGGFNARGIFAQNVLGLNDPVDVEDYERLGPAWFYGHHRDIVIQHGRNIHVQMIQDAETYDPQAAAEMGRDLLKSTGTGMAGGVLMAEGRVG